MEEITKEQIEKSIKATFDSVKFIEALNLILELTEEELDAKNINIEHLRIMMKREWFIEHLTSEQRNRNYTTNGQEVSRNSLPTFLCFNFFSPIKIF